MVVGVQLEAKLEEMQAVLLAAASLVCSIGGGGAHTHDAPVSPESMQKMIGKGFDVRWAEFEGDMLECVSDRASPSRALVSSV